MARIGRSFPARTTWIRPVPATTSAPSTPTPATAVKIRASGTFTRSTARTRASGVFTANAVKVRASGVFT